MSFEYNLTITIQNRKACKKVLDSLSTEQINEIPEGFNNNILWNCGHIISVQQMLIYGLSNVPFSSDMRLINQFLPGTRPNAYYGSDMINEVKMLLFSTFEQIQKDITTGVFSNFNPFRTAINFEISNLESAIAFNQYHEALHMGHMLNIKRFLKN